jgi:hypothetical protein
MKVHPVSVIVTVVVSAWLSGVSRGQPTGDSETMEVRTVATGIVRALMLGNTDLISSYLAPDYVCIDVAGNAINKSARLKQLREAGLKFSSVESEQQSVQHFGQTVVVTGVLEVNGSMAGRDISGRYRYLDVLIKRDGKWVAIASTMTRVQPSTAAPAR